MTEGQPVFEDSLKSLEEVVKKLEAGDLSLEDSLKLFEKGIKASNACRKTLDEARKRVQKLVSENGSFSLEMLDEEEP